MKRTTTLFVVIFSLFYKHEAAIIDKFFANSNNSFVDEDNSKWFDDTESTLTATTEIIKEIPKGIPEDYFRCPQKTGRYPHPSDHARYYTCKHFEPILGNCPQGSLYDVATKKCEDEAIARTARTPPPLRSGDDEFEGNDENFLCRHNGVFPHPDDCDKYIACVQGEAYIYKCWAKLFDTGLNSCNYAELTDCDERKRPTGLPGTITPPTTPRPTTPIYECPPNTGNQYLFKDPYDCTAFYYCTHGVTKRSVCPLGHNQEILYFHEMIQQCDHPANVPCSNVS